MRAIPPTPGSVTSRPVEKAEALRRRAPLPARTPLGARAAIGAAPALDLDLERFASPVAHHAAAEIPSAVPGAPPRLLLRSRFGRHVVVPSARRCIPEATPGRPILVATPLFHLEMSCAKPAASVQHPAACRGSRH